MPCPESRFISMQYNPEIHRRRSTRLRGYDYSLRGAYFVTICSVNRVCLFGEIVNGEIRLHQAGLTVQECWEEIPAHFPDVELDAFVVMPNHVHGIIVVSAGKGSACRDRSMASISTTCRGPKVTCRAPMAERFGRPVPGSVPTVIRSFKSAATKRTNQMRRCPGARLWQRNYWEHIIRNETELSRLREYVLTNPMRWELDRLHPDQTGFGVGGSGSRNSCR